MFFDYFRLSEFGDSLPLMDLISRLSFILLFALMLAILGNKFKHHLGAVFALAYGVLIFLYNQWALRF